MQVYSLSLVHIYYDVLLSHFSEPPCIFFLNAFNINLWFHRSLSLFSRLFPLLLYTITSRVYKLSLSFPCQHSFLLFIFLYQSHKSSTASSLHPLSFASISPVVHKQYVSVPAPLWFSSEGFFLFLAPIYYVFGLFFCVFPHCTVLPVSLALYCAPHVALSFVQGLNTTLGDKDPPLDTDKRSHYTEGRQSQLHSALSLSYVHTFIQVHKHTHTQKHIQNTPCMSNLIKDINCSYVLHVTCTQTCNDSTFHPQSRNISSSMWLGSGKKH